MIINLRQDPFERTPSIRSENLNNLGGGYMNDFMAREFWRFVLVQKYVGELAKTALIFLRCKRQRASTSKRSRNRSRKPSRPTRGNRYANATGAL